MRKATTQFISFNLEQITREENREADELARLASSMDVISRGEVTLLRAESKLIEKEEVKAVVEGEDLHGETLSITIEREKTRTSRK